MIARFLVLFALLSHQCRSDLREGHEKGAAVIRIGVALDSFYNKNEYTVAFNYFTGWAEWYLWRYLDYKIEIRKSSQEQKVVLPLQPHQEYWPIINNLERLEKKFNGSRPDIIVILTRYENTDAFYVQHALTIFNYGRYLCGDTPVGTVLSFSLESAEYAAQKLSLFIIESLRSTNGYTAGDWERGTPLSPLTEIHKKLRKCWKQPFITGSLVRSDINAKIDVLLNKSIQEYLQERPQRQSLSTFYLWDKTWGYWPSFENGSVSEVERAFRREGNCTQVEGDSSRVSCPLSFSGLKLRYNMTLGIKNGSLDETAQHRNPVKVVDGGKVEATVKEGRGLFLLREDIVSHEFRASSFIVTSMELNPPTFERASVAAGIEILETNDAKFRHKLNDSINFWVKNYLQVQAVFRLLGEALIYQNKGLLPGST